MFSNAYIIPDNPALPVIFFDLTLEEAHEGETTPADSPIESGAVITDHLVHKPRPLNLTVYMTNTPLPGTRSSVVQGDLGRVAALWAQLEKTRQAGSTLQVLTTIGTYYNMVITKPAMTVKNVFSSTITIALREIQTAYSASVSPPPVPLEPRGAAATDKGAQSTTAPSQPLVSTLSKLTPDALGATVHNLLGPIGTSAP